MAQRRGAHFFLEPIPQPALLLTRAAAAFGVPFAGTFAGKRSWQCPVVSSLWLRRCSCYSSSSWEGHRFGWTMAWALSKCIHTIHSGCARMRGKHIKYISNHCIYKTNSIFHVLMSGGVLKVEFRVSKFYIVDWGILAIYRSFDN